MSSINERMTAFEQLDAMLVVILLAIGITFGNRVFYRRRVASEVSKGIEFIADLVHQLKLERVVQDVPIHWAVAQIDQIVGWLGEKLGKGELRLPPN